MKRNLKNIIMIVLLIAAFGSIYLTMDYAKNNLSNSNDGTMLIGGNGDSTMEKPSDDTTTDTDSENTSLDKPSNSGSTDNSSESTPPDKPDGDTSSDTSSSEPPEKPDGETDSNTTTSNQTSTDNSLEMPSDSNNNMGSMPDMGKMESDVELTTIYYVVFAVEGLVISIILVYLLLSNFNKKTVKETFANKDKIIIYVLSCIVLTGVITFASVLVTNNYFLNQENSSKENGSGNGGSSSSDITYSSSYEITSDTTIDNGSYTSSTSDENAISVSGDIDVEISDVTVEKTGDSDGGDNTSFYGTNSAIIAKDGSNLVLKNITVTTDADGANGVFSYGGSATTTNNSSDGTTITISDSTITTTKDNSGGIMTTGGGTMIANNLTINTAGTSSAAIRSDRGGGTVTVTKGTYKTTGTGSPAIYSTADITVSDATLIATTSEGIIIEGKNSVSIDNCTLTDSNTKLNGQSTTYKNIFLYQSMSGDADSGTAEFSAKDSTITTNNGDTFYITNTTATITLENNKIINNDSDGNFLRSQKDSWGNSGSNGGDVTLVMTNQDAVGNIVIDSVSTLDMTLKSSSYYEGTINGSNEAKSINLTLDKSSKIKLTGDSYVTTLEDSDSTYSNIDFNGYTLYVNGEAIN